MVTVLEGVNHLPIPAMGFGLIALGILIVGLLWVLSLGGSRPHS